MATITTTPLHFWTNQAFNVPAGNDRVIVAFQRSGTTTSVTWNSLSFTSAGSGVFYLFVGSNASDSSQSLTKNSGELNLFVVDGVEQNNASTVAANTLNTTSMDITISATVASVIIMGAQMTTGTVTGITPNTDIDGSGFLKGALDETSVGGTYTATYSTTNSNTFRGIKMFPAAAAVATTDFFAMM